MKTVTVAFPSSVRSLCISVTTALRRSASHKRHLVANRSLRYSSRCFAMTKKYGSSLSRSLAPSSLFMIADRVIEVFKYTMNRLRLLLYLYFSQSSVWQEKQRGLFLSLILALESLARENLLLRRLCLVRLAIVASKFCARYTNERMGDPFSGSSAGKQISLDSFLARHTYLCAVRVCVPISVYSCKVSLIISRP